MAEDTITPEEIPAEEEKSIWELMELDEPAGDEPYADEQDDADEEIAKQDKMDRKLSAKMEDMQQKLENTIIRDRIGKFQETADDLHKDLFRAVASDVKDVESFDKAMKMVNDRAEKMKAAEEKYKQEMEKRAQEQAATAWGTGPMGTPTPHTADYEEELYKRVREGDEKAAFELIIGDDWPQL